MSYPRATHEHAIYVNKELLATLQYTYAILIIPLVQGRPTQIVDATHIKHTCNQDDTPHTSINTNVLE